MLAQEVLKNLMISAIEFRSEEDADVEPYKYNSLPLQYN